MTTYLFDCGCRIGAIPGNAVGLKQCPLHAAADDLLAACKQAYSYIGQQWIGIGLEVSEQLGTAIAKAERKDPT